MANSQRSSSSPPRRPQAENRDFVTGLIDGNGAFQCLSCEPDETHARCGFGQTVRRSALGANCKILSTRCSSRSPSEGRSRQPLPEHRSRLRAIGEHLQQIGKLGVTVPFHEALHTVGPATAARLAHDRQRRATNVGPRGDGADGGARSAGNKSRRPTSPVRA
jgi:hypothetical protein